MKKYDAVVYIGRFQPPHLAHIEIIKQALKQAPLCVVLVGSANQPRTIKNPFTWLERAEMILASLPDQYQEQVIIRPLEDHMYNDQHWAASVHNTVMESLHGFPTDNIAKIGHMKDRSSYYLSMFPQWDDINIDQIEDIHATEVRKAYFSSNGEDFDIKVGRNLPSAIHDYLKAFMLRPEYDNLCNEYEFIKSYKSAWDSAPYPPVFVTVDAVVIQSGHVLLVRRRAAPGSGLFALPGGFINHNERIIDACIRELKEETKIKVSPGMLRSSIKEVKVYDHPDRSLRGRTITHVHLIELMSGDLCEVRGGDDADKAVWVPLGTFKRMQNQMFEDHFHIVNDMVDKL